MFGRPRQLFGAVIALFSRLTTPPRVGSNREFVEDWLYDKPISPGLWIPITMFALENKSSRTVY